MTITLTERPKFSEPELLKFAANGNVALHGSKTDRGFKLAGILGVTSLGINGDRTPTHFTDHGFSYGEGRASFGRQYWWGTAKASGTTSPPRRAITDDVKITNSTVTNYKGSVKSGTTTVTSESRFSASSGGFSFETMNINIESNWYDQQGNHTGGSKGGTSSSTTTYPDGSSDTDSKFKITHYDKDGNVTGSTTIVIKQSTDADGNKKSEVWETNCDGDGNCGEPEYACVGPGCDDSGGGDGDEPGDTGGDPCQGEDCPPAGNETEGMPNPDSTGVGVVTAADWARVEAFLNSTRTPDRNSDEPEIPDTPPNTGPYDPMVAMVDPDGVFTLSVTMTPDFNKAQPKYDPTLNDIIGIAGIEPPVRQEPDPVSWP